MDHLSFMVKPASRGQWCVNTLRSPTFTISKPTKSPLSSFIPSLLPPPGPAGQQQQVNTDSVKHASTSTAVRQQVFTPQMQQVQSSNHLAAFAQWLQARPTSNSPGLPQGPQAQECGFTLPHCCRVLHAHHCERSEPTASLGTVAYCSCRQSTFKLILHGCIYCIISN